MESDKEDKETETDEETVETTEETKERQKLIHASTIEKERNQQTELTLHRRANRYFLKSNSDILLL